MRNKPLSQKVVVEERDRNTLPYGRIGHIPFDSSFSFGMEAGFRPSTLALLDTPPRFEFKDKKVKTKSNGLYKEKRI
jgi:hypothetical protein